MSTIDDDIMIIFGSKFLKYIEMYTEMFSLLPFIHFEYKVKNVSKCEEGGFLVTYSIGNDEIKR